VKKYRRAGHVARKRKLVNVYGVLVQKETHGRPSGRWETLILKNLRFYINKILNWICDSDFVAEDRDTLGAVVNTVMNCRVK
jgi:hypothetical protein